MIIDHTVRAIRDAGRNHRVLVSRVWPQKDDPAGPRAIVWRIIDARLVGDVLYALELETGNWFVVSPTDEIYTVD